MEAIDVRIKSLTIIHGIRTYDFFPCTVLIMSILHKTIYYYETPMTQWEDIKRDVKGKSGVYVLVNNITGDVFPCGTFYIGSGICLYSRLRDYWQDWYQISRGNTLIVRAMRKYGQENFSIAIVELTNEGGAVAAEQVWINNFEPRYNILTTASSSLGYVHTEEARAKISVAMVGKPRSPEVRSEMSVRQQGSSNTFFGKSHSPEAKELLRQHALARVVSHKPSTPVNVLDTTTNYLHKFTSIRKATVLLKCSITTVHKYNGKLYKGRYRISVLDVKP